MSRVGCCVAMRARALPCLRLPAIFLPKSPSHAIPQPHHFSPASKSNRGCREREREKSHSKLPTFTHHHELTQFFFGSRRNRHLTSLSSQNTFRPKSCQSPHPSTDHHSAQLTRTPETFTTAHHPSSSSIHIWENETPASYCLECIPPLISPGPLGAQGTTPPASLGKASR